MRSQGALLTDVTDIYYGRSAYYEGGGILHDSFENQYNQDSNTDISDTAFMTVNLEAGQTFNLLDSNRKCAGRVEIRARC
jgi:hypothetical protein